MSENRIWENIGDVAGLIAAPVTFIGVYAAAVHSVGWVIGIALGWIPAGLAAFLSFVVFRYLWWLALLFVLVVIENGWPLW